MTQVNIRIGKESPGNQFVCSVNGVTKALEPTLELALRMKEVGVNNEIVIDGETLYVTTYLIEDDRIIAEAVSKEEDSSW